MARHTDGMRRETYLIRIVMGAVILTAITINTVLEININSSSLVDRGEGTSDFKTLSEFYQWK